MNDIIVNSLKYFLQILFQICGVKDNGEKDKVRGRRLLEDQNTYDAVMTALNNDELNKEKLGRLFVCQKKVSHCEIKREGAMRKDMKYMDRKRCIWRPLVVLKNAIGVGKLVLDYGMLMCSHSRRSHHYLLTTYRT